MPLGLRSMLAALAIPALSIALPTPGHADDNASRPNATAVAYSLTDVDPSAETSPEFTDSSRSDAAVNQVEEQDPFIDDPLDPIWAADRGVTYASAPSAQWVIGAEYLGWWLKGNRVPPLVTTGPNEANRDEAGVIGADGTRILLGDERLDKGLRHGACVTLLHWLDDTQSIGWELSLFGLGGDNTSFSSASTGLPILARPFYNVLEDAQFAELVAYPDVIEGVVGVDTSSELYSASALLRRNYVSGSRLNVDLLGGYRFLRFRESLGITENLISRDPQGDVQIGTQIDLRDSFDGVTDFHGGELGLATQMIHGPISLDVVTKLGIGAVRQRVTVDGHTTVTTPGDDPFTSLGGLLALPTNIGSYRQHRFALLPEIDLTLNCQVTDCLSVSLGYSLLYLTEAMRTGDQIDYTINPTLLPGNSDPITGPLRPLPQMKSTSLWAQGINIGGVLVF